VDKNPWKESGDYSFVVFCHAVFAPVLEGFLLVLVSASIYAVFGFDFDGGFVT
jgi:hypothetical protein